MVKKRRKSTRPVVRKYTKGKKLFGKHAGEFVFGKDKAEDKKKQLKLDL